MSSIEKKFPTKELEDLLELIKISNQQIAQGHKVGHPEDDLMIRQAKYRKQKYTKELLELLKDFDLPIQLLEQD